MIRWRRAVHRQLLHRTAAIACCVAAVGVGAGPWTDTAHRVSTLATQPAVSLPIVAVNPDPATDPSAATSTDPLAAAGGPAGRHVTVMFNGHRATVTGLDTPAQVGDQIPVVPDPTDPGRVWAAESITGAQRTGADTVRSAGPLLAATVAGALLLLTVWRTAAPWRAVRVRPVPRTMLDVRVVRVTRLTRHRFGGVRRWHPVPAYQVTVAVSGDLAQTRKWTTTTRTLTAPTLAQDAVLVAGPAGHGALVATDTGQTWWPHRTWLHADAVR